MSVTVFQRLSRADGRELRHRAGAAARQARDRLRLALRSPRWNRSDIRPVLSTDFRNKIGLGPAIDRADWSAAHRIIFDHYADNRARFLPGFRCPAETRAVVAARFPEAAAEARVSADRLLDGTIDVLGYRALRVRDANSRDIDWHRDPVHGRRPPFRFWAAVPYLDPAGGDHKVIWEINRHQHWLALGRAAWLTGDTRYAGEVVDQLESWLRQNPPLVGVNWASMLELAFRSLSWLWGLAICTGMPEHDSTACPWTIDLLVGLDAQLEQVRVNLSRYFSPNTHLLGEALALYVVGRSLPEAANAARWAEVGRQVLLQERTRQVNSDGGHAELSPHYHRYALDFYLLALAIARLSSDAAAVEFEKTARRLADYMRSICDDQGRMPLIGDDDGGQMFPVCGRPPWDAAPSLACASALLDDPQLAIGRLTEESIWLVGPRANSARVLPDPESPAAENARLSVVAFPDTGYYVARTAAGDHLVFDAGRHGFLNGGHAHADALAVVFTSRGRPLLIDPGTSTYTMDREVRDRFRATRMHNTVVVDGRDQSEPDGPFRWRKRTNAFTRFLAHCSRACWFEAQHEGYAPILHRRSVLLLDDGTCVVVDHLIGDEGASHEATAHWHLAPEWRAEAVSDDTVRVTSGDGGVRHISTTGAACVVRGDAEGLGWCAPVYGQLEPASTLVVRSAGALPLTIATVIVPGRPRLLMQVIHRENDIGTVLDIDAGQSRRRLISWTECRLGPARPRVDNWRFEGMSSHARAVVIDRSAADPVILCTFGEPELELAPAVHAEAP